MSDLPSTVVVHDWLESYTGSERILEQILRALDEPELMCLLDVLPPERRHGLPRPVATSFLARWPGARKRFRWFLPFMPTAIESLDVSRYGLVVSSSHAVAKGVLTRPDQLHVAYLHQRNLKYCYDERALYRSRFAAVNVLQEVGMTAVRTWDAIASRRPDVTVAISRYVADWHKHRHGVDSTVIYPPVDVDYFVRSYREDKLPFYVMVSRLEPYKRADLVVEAFNRLGREVYLLGDGSQRRQLERRAAPNVRFLGYQPPDVIARYLSQAQAFIFPSREDFGIAPLEAQACGTPVLAYAAGGALETIRGLDHEAPTGVFFPEQSVEALIAAVTTFEEHRERLRGPQLQANVARFGNARFRSEIREFVARHWREFRATRP